MQEQLFPELDKTRYGESFRHKRLILPKPLDEQTKNKQIVETPAFENAYTLFCKWADLEKAGKLSPKTESSLESEFLTEIFGAALGYKLFSENAEKWEIEPKYAINGGQADAVVGTFSTASRNVRAVIELKGPTVNLDRDKFNGRTPVQQCWDYLNHLPECPWGIVSNFVSFRLYHRDHTPRVFERFALKDLRDVEKFKCFYVLFQRDGLLGTMLQPPRTDTLLELSINREREVGDQLYNYYHQSRIQLIEHLRQDPYSKTLDQAIRIAQKLLDRVVFIAFCEDRGMLPARTLRRAWEDVSPFARATNPRWQNFLDLFQSIDKGNHKAKIAAFNGGLFRTDPEVDDLELDDDLTTIFQEIGKYDFQDEINVDVLGHLFERSVHDIERIKTGGLFGEQYTDETTNKMSKSAERKRSGIYYTPPAFTEFIAYNTVAQLARERFEAIASQMGIDLADAETTQKNSKAAEYWQACYEAVKAIKVVDPACGSGAFLIQAYDTLDDLYHYVLEHLSFQGVDISDLRKQTANWILSENIYGVDLSLEAVEITQLALWLRSADIGKTLADLSQNIVCGNSLIDDPKTEMALDWKTKFKAVFERPAGGFDCVIGNPPWERMKLQEREFFDGRDTAIASAVSAAKRRSLIEKLEKKNPELYQLYQKAIVQADQSLTYIRTSGRYPLTGKGDINTYAVFAELACNLIHPQGRVGVLVPSGIATDNTTKDFFANLVDLQRLVGLYDFENKKPVFADVHRSFKFSILLFSGQSTKNEKFDFVFFAREVEELAEKNRHIRLTAKDIRLLNPNTRTCPIFRSNKDAELTKAIYRRVPVLIDKSRKKDGNPWGVNFLRMFDQTNDAELFHTAEQLKELKYKQDGPIWKKGKSVFVPLYEAKMIQMYDHRAASVVIDESNWMRQGQTSDTTLVQHQNPEYFAESRWWADREKVEESFDDCKQQAAFLTFKDVTSSTNQRTMIASFVPFAGMLNSAPLILADKTISCRRQSCLLANLNSYVYDFVARQKVGGVHLNFFIIEQLPVFTPDFYGDKCPWSKKQTLEKWISERVLKLTCTSDDMRPLADAAGFAEGVHKWKEDDRAQLMAELDAAYFILYGMKRDDVIYILSTFQGLVKEGQNLFDNETAKLILSCYDEYQTISKKS